MKFFEREPTLIVICVPLLIIAIFLHLISLVKSNITENELSGERIECGEEVFFIPYEKDEIYKKVGTKDKLDGIIYIPGSEPNNKYLVKDSSVIIEE